MNIILYVMDALRADYLSCYGFAHDTSPNLDALARDGVLYENAYSVATWTKPAAASMLTSRYPRAIRMMDAFDKIPGTIKLLPEVLNEDGFHTCAISTNAFFSPEFGFRGFDQFLELQKDEEVVKKCKVTKDASEDGSQWLHRLGIEKEFVIPSQYAYDVARESLRFVDSLEKFVMVWSTDTHGPYFLRGEASHFGNSSDDFILEKQVNERNLGKVKSLYCDMIRYNDYTLGQLIAELKRQDEYENSMIIATADHGDSFGDHSYRGAPIIGHNGLVYQEVVKIPLIIKFPRANGAGTRCSFPVQLIDIAPTILGTLGIDTDWEMQGVQIQPGKASVSLERRIFVESQVSATHPYSAAVVRGRHKFMTMSPRCPRTPLFFRKNPRAFMRNLRHAFSPQPSTFLFDLSRDPAEKRDIYEREHQTAEALLREYEQFLSACEESARKIGPQERAVPDAELSARLRALGYLV